MIRIASKCVGAKGRVGAKSEWGRVICKYLVSVDSATTPKDYQYTQTNRRISTVLAIRRHSRLTRPSLGKKKLCRKFTVSRLIPVLSSARGSSVPRLDAPTNHARFFDLRSKVARERGEMVFGFSSREEFREDFECETNLETFARNLGIRGASKGGYTMANTKD